MATRGRVERGSRPRARAANVVVPLPRRISGERLDLARLVPSGRSLGIAFLIVVGAAVAYLGARETGVFSVRTIDVAGAPAAVQVAGAPCSCSDAWDEPAQGRPRCVAAHGGGVAHRCERALRSRLSAHAPHRRRARAAGGRRAPGSRQLPRRRERPRDGRHRPPQASRAGPDLGRPLRRARRPAPTPQGDLRTAIGAVAPLAGSHFPGRVTSVTATADALTLRLRSGLELRLGDPLDVALKLAVAARVIPLLYAGTTYLDVAVPERPVAGTLNSQVEVDASPSTTP